MTVIHAFPDFVPAPLSPLTHRRLRETPREISRLYLTSQSAVVRTSTVSMVYFDACTCYISESLGIRASLLDLKPFVPVVGEMTYRDALHTVRVPLHPDRCAARHIYIFNDSAIARVTLIERWSFDSLRVHAWKCYQYSTYECACVF